MAIIQYGKSVFPGNARTRRHRRRQSLSRLKRCIDHAFGLEPLNLTLRSAERISQRQSLSRVDRAISAPLFPHRKPVAWDHCCLPHVHLYAMR
jgi:hypothetical protein